MRMPLFGYSLSAWGWFNVIFGIAAMAFVMLLNVHTRRRLALLEVGWLGRGQWLFLLVLWVFVIGNFGRIVVHFTEQRLLTEGVITLNAVLATMLVLLVPRTIAPAPGEFRRTTCDWSACAAIAAVLFAVAFPVAETLSVRAVYGNAPVQRPARRRARPDHALRPARRLEASAALAGQRPPLTRASALAKRTRTGEPPA